MKILQISRQFHPAVGGIESVVFHLSHALQADGYQVEVAALNRQWNDNKILPMEETVEGIRIRRVSFLGNSRYAIAPSIFREVKGYDLIHLHSSDFFLDFLAFSRPFHRIPLILHTHGLYFHTPFASGIKKIYLQSITKQALRQVSAVICDSLHDIYLLKNVVDPRKVFLIPNGVEVGLSNGVEKARDKNLILSVGRLAVNKRYQLLLEAFARVQSKMPKVHLVIIGKDQGELVGLRQLTDRLDISEKVQFLGEVSDETLKLWLARAAIWTTASNYESFGIALLESMSAGCIPVVQRLEAFKDFLEDGQNGFFTDFVHPDAAAEKVIYALELNEDERQLIVREGIDTAKRYSWKNIATQVEEVYRKVLERPDNENE